LSLARSYLEDAKRFFEDRLYHWSVLSCQLSVENSAKAVISCFRPPSWMHDSGPELTQVMGEHERAIADCLREEEITELRNLAKASTELAPEHGAATYGFVNERKLPIEVYDERSSGRALSLADRSYITAQKFLRRWFT